MAQTPMPEFQISTEIPVSTNEMMPPEKDRLDVTELGKWVKNNIDVTMKMRRSIELDWLKIRYILSGYHYFAVNPFTGTIDPLPPDDDEVRAHVNLMLNRYRRELGRRLSVATDITTIPKSMRTPGASYLAKSAMLALEEWRTEEEFDLIYDRATQIVLRMGGVGYLVEPSWDNKTAKLHTIPPCDLFPLPTLASSDDQAAGIVYRKFLSEAWIEESVKEGKLDAAALTMINKHTTQDRVGSPFVSGAMGFSQASLKGAVGFFFYLKPGRQYPEGLHGLAIDDKVFSIYVNERTGRPGLPVGGEPIFVRDTEIDSDWYPQSFCAPLISLNLEGNRQLSNEIATSEINRHGGWTMVPEGMIAFNDMHQEYGGFIPYKDEQLGLDKRSPFFTVSPPRIGPESSLVSARIEREADETASHFGVSRGEAPGRIEGDPALQRLLAQTEMPNEPYFRRSRVAFVKIFSRIMDVLSGTWEKDKWLSVVGHLNHPQEMVLGQREMPSSKHVKIMIGPLVPGSRQGTLQMLVMLLKLGRITPQQFGRALVANGIQPTGVDLDDKDEIYAMGKTLILYNDGQKPGDFPRGDDFAMEPHETVVRVMREFMNTIPFKLNTSNAVKAKLLDEMREHLIAMNRRSRLQTQDQLIEADRGRFEAEIGAAEDALLPDNNLLFAL